MNQLLIYALKVNASLLLFYLFYMLMYRRDTFWKIRRAYLLVAVIFSFIYPLMQFGAWFQQQEPVQTFAAAINLNEFVITSSPKLASSPSVFTTENILLAVYILVAFALIFKMILQMISILYKAGKGEKTEVNDVKVINLNENITPFSFFNLIFINKSQYSEVELPEILTHELSHVRQKHSYDVILSELTTALCWFNPFAWLLKKEIKQNLEFLADNQVVKSGFEAKKYQYLLLNISCNYIDNQLINQFNISPIKKRITMMNKPKTSKKGLIKYSLIIPVALVMIIINSAQNISAKIQNNNDSEPQKPVSITVTAVDSATKKISVNDIPENKVIVIDEADASKIFDVVEVPPKFPGNESALMKYISDNIKYPEEAKEKNIQGRAVVMFIVDQTGKVIEPKVVNNINPLLSAEAIRVVSSMPNWIPGKQGGQNVSCKFFIPVNFKLDGGKAEAGMSKSNKEFPEPSYYQIDRKEVSKEEFEKIANSDKGKNAMSMLMPPKQAIEFFGEKAKDGAAILSTTKEIIKKDMKEYMNSDYKEPQAYDIVDTPPSFPGGEKALMQYLAQNIKYPVIAQENNVMGRIIVKFIVSKEGKIKNAEVSRTDFNDIKPELTVVGYGSKEKKEVNKPTKESIEEAQTALRNEALRVVNAMPDWTPGKNKGKNVDAIYYIPINFKLQ